jgi:hypothetical protein
MERAMIVLLSTFISMASAQDADVRLLHLSPDAGDLEAYAGGTLAASGVSYLEGSAPSPIAPGFQQVDVAESGSAGATVFATTFVDFQANDQYDLVAYGSQASMGILALASSAGGVPGGSNRLQFANVAEGTPAMDIYLPAIDQVVADDLPYGGNDTVQVAASGPFTVMLDIDDDSGADWIFDLPDIGSGQDVNMLVTSENGDLSMVIWLQDGTVEVVPGLFIPKPTVQFVHLSPDLPATDVYIGFSFLPIFENMTFGTASLPASIKRGQVGFTLAPAGLPPTSPFGEGATRLEAETDYTVFTYGEEANLRYGSVIDMEEVPGSLAVRVLHTALGVGPTTVSIDGTIVDSFVRRGQGHEAYYSTGAFQLGFDNTLDGVDDFVFDVPDYGTASLNLFLATSEALETRLYVDQPDGTLLVLDPL